MKGIERSPIAVVLLTLITCGIYGYFWMYSVRWEMKVALNDASISPGLEIILAILCFPFWFIWYYMTARDVAKMQAKAGMPADDKSILYIVLAIFGLGIVNNYIIQDDLNHLWQNDISE